MESAGLSLQPHFPSGNEHGHLFLSTFAVVLRNAVRAVEAGFEQVPRPHDKVPREEGRPGAAEAPDQPSQEQGLPGASFPPTFITKNCEHPEKL